jgi:hypothetical protein
MTQTSTVRPTISYLNIPKTESEAVEITMILNNYKNKYNNIYVTCAIIAVILSWNCNKENTFIYKILYSIIAIILSYWYLLFYLIYYVILQNNCSNEITFNINLSDINFNFLKNKLFSRNG